MVQIMRLTARALRLAWLRNTDVRRLLSLRRYFVSWVQTPKEFPVGLNTDLIRAWSTLLHVVEMFLLQGAPPPGSGPSIWSFSTTLHDSLAKTHKQASCRNAACPWNSTADHECSYNRGFSMDPCPLWPFITQLDDDHDSEAPWDQDASSPNFSTRGKAIVQSVVSRTKALLHTHDTPPEPQPVFDEELLEMTSLVRRLHTYQQVSAIVDAEDTRCEEVEEPEDSSRPAASRAHDAVTPEGEKPTNPLPATMMTAAPDSDSDTREVVQTS